jgi:hypothetical protein
LWHDAQVAWPGLTIAASVWWHAAQAGAVRVGSWAELAWQDVHVAWPVEAALVASRA